MKKILIGFAFIFINVVFWTVYGGFDVMPDFIGYVFLFLGVQELVAESYFFEKVKKYVAGLVLVSMVQYALNALVLRYLLVTVTFAVNVAVGIAFISVSYNIIMGLIDIEKKCGADLKAESIKSTWIITVIALMGTLLPINMPEFHNSCWIVEIIFAILLLGKIYRTAILYDRVKVNSNAV